MIKEIHDHGDLCTWHNLHGERCSQPAVIGSAKTALCSEHVRVHRKLTMEPDAYVDWLKSHESE